MNNIETFELTTEIIIKQKNNLFLNKTRYTNKYRLCCFPI